MQADEDLWQYVRGGEGIIKRVTKESYYRMCKYDVKNLLRSRGGE